MLNTYKLTKRLICFSSSRSLLHPLFNIFLQLYYNIDIYEEYYKIKYYNKFDQLFKTDLEGHVVRSAKNENIYVKYQ